MPLVSVIIPTYNYAEYIIDAIESVLSQDFPEKEIEIIIVDDGSTDNTQEKIKKYKGKLIYIKTGHFGKAWATKLGIEASQGNYIFTLDADDLFLSHKISKVVDIFEKEKKIVHIGHPALCWKMKENAYSKESIPQNILMKKMKGDEMLLFFLRRNIFFGGGSTFSARSDILKKIFIPKEIDMLADQYLLLYTLNYGDSLILDEALSIWRIHNENYSIKIPDYEKIKRNIFSIEFTLKEIENSNLDKEIKILYSIWALSSKLAFLELINKKGFIDVMNMWAEILKYIKIRRKETLNIIRNYKIINRTLPSIIIKVLKKAIKQK